jgi:hypothetical protein
MITTDISLCPNCYIFHVPIADQNFRINRFNLYIRGSFIKGSTVMWNYLACYSVVHSVICGHITAQCSLAWKNHMLLHDKIESCAHFQKILQAKVFYLPSITVLSKDCVELILFNLMSYMKRWFITTWILE